MNFEEKVEVDETESEDKEDKEDNNDKETVEGIDIITIPYYFQQPYIPFKIFFQNYNF